MQPQLNWAMLVSSQQVCSVSYDMYFFDLNTCVYLNLHSSVYLYDSHVNTDTSTCLDI